MTMHHTPSLAAASAAIQPTPSVHQLRSAVETMDSLAQEGFAQIAAIAKLALSHLQTANGWQHVDTLAHALEAIQGKAEVQHDCISHEAREVGCGWQDAAAQRRMTAQRTVTQLEVAA